MRIYVACLASYNNGVLHGDWIDLEGMDADGVREEITAILRESPHPNVSVECPDCDGTGRRGGADHQYEARRLCGGIAEAPPSRVCGTCNGIGKVPSAEEWAVHDYDDVPGEWGEHPDLDKLCEFVETLEELDDTEREAFIAYRDNEGDQVTVDSFRDAYAGQHDSWEAFAQEYVEESGLLQGVPDTLARYFDFEGYGRDMRLGGDAYEVDGFYFWNR